MSFFNTVSSTNWNPVDSVSALLGSPWWWEKVVGKQLGAAENRQVWLILSWIFYLLSFCVPSIWLLLYFLCFLLIIPSLCFSLMSSPLSQDAAFSSHLKLLHSLRGVCLQWLHRTNWFTDPILKSDKHLNGLVKHFRKWDTGNESMTEISSWISTSC